jgi:hypothetical protein
MKRLSLAVAVGLALLGATACGPSDLADPATALVASVEAEALAAMGVDPAELVAAEAALDPTPAPSPRGDGEKVKDRLDNWKKRHALRVALRKGTLHGEAVVQTKKGDVTVVVQRGVVTAMDDKTITVKSSDGVTMTWSLGEKLRVVEKRSTVQPTAVQVGAAIALAGAKDEDTPVARLIVLGQAG